MSEPLVCLPGYVERCRQNQENAISEAAIEMELAITNESIGQSDGHKLHLHNAQTLLISALYWDEQAERWSDEGDPD